MLNMIKQIPCKHYVDIFWGWQGGSHHTGQAEIRLERENITLGKTLSEKNTQNNILVIKDYLPF